MKIQILDQAIEDLIEGFHFYEDHQPGLGTYFLTAVRADIESLRIYGGIHRQAYKHYHRLLSKRFPFAVFYTFREDTVYVQAIVDGRRDPAWSRKRLG